VRAKCRRCLPRCGVAGSTMCRCLAAYKKCIEEGQRQKIEEHWAIDCMHRSFSHA
jgi:hypothetical protein